MRTQFDGIGLNDSGSSYKRRVATISPDYRESGHTLARAITACHGLDIPEGVPPGAVAELVAAARQLYAQARHYGPTNRAELGGPHVVDVLERAASALALFKTD